MAVATHGSRDTASPVAGLTEAGAAARLAAAPPPPSDRSSRSCASIVRANVFTVFNAILLAFGLLTLLFGEWQDALFLGVVVALAPPGWELLASLAGATVAAVGLWLVDDRFAPVPPAP